MASCDELGVWVMPYFGDTAHSADDLKAAVESVRLQTASSWKLVIVDDASPNRGADAFLRSLSNDANIVVQSHPKRLGPGPSRNAGITRAQELGASFVLFLDSDDIAAQNRLELVSWEFRDPVVDVLYSLFEPIDLLGNSIAVDDLTPSIASILKGLSIDPLEGYDVWQQMARSRGYINLTSTTNVRIELAMRVPFPAELVSEDFHTWIRYSAMGGYFKFIPINTSKYRIPNPLDGSSCRRRYGAGYYREKARVDSEGFEEAIRLGLHRGVITPPEGLSLRAAYRSRIAQEMESERESSLAAVLRQLSPDKIVSREFFESCHAP